MTTQVQQAGVLSGRSMALMVVIALHALVISALMTMKMVPNITVELPPALQWFVDQPPPPPPEKNIIEGKRTVPDPPVDYVPRDFDIKVIEDAQIQETTLTASASQDAAETVAEGSQGTGVTIIESPAPVATALQYRITRSSDEYYPETSLMLQERGIAIVRVCVDGAGKMTGAPMVESSSGSKRLDQAAVRWARESLSFTPATKDGVGVPACKGFRVNFDLH